MTPKQEVLKRYPRAYAAKASARGPWVVYEHPAKAVPRGSMAVAVMLGSGLTAMHAWKDAQARLHDETVQASAPRRKSA
jgi:hypothetical protein